MSRGSIALLLFIYGCVALLIGEFQIFDRVPDVNAAIVGETIGKSFVVYYLLSGMIPFAFWGARGFQAKNAATNLFIPWAVFAAALAWLLWYGQG
jgi:hypothetical protein